MTNNARLLDEFEEEMKRAGKSNWTIRNRGIVCRSLVKFIGAQDVRQLSAETVKAFFDSRKLSKLSARTYSTSVALFLRFVAERVPVVVTEKQGPTAVPARLSANEAELRKGWAIARLVEQKENGDDLIAKLARKLIDHYLYFQGRMRGEPENLDDIYRFADECKDLIETNLPLFMKLSAQGRNIHSAIDERVQK
ncbi:MAG: hypothetical protein Q8S00_04755 [Deltaproteobacteria bacterium]|nr:hypothetical protein [Deltaproteobacteria bacterium]